MHKKMKLFVSMLAAVAMLVLLPGSNTMTAHAEEAKTYSIKYIGGNVNDWRYVPGSTFEDGASHRDLYYLLTYDLKDDDLIVIYPGDEVPNGKELDLSGFRLSNLTIYQNANVVIKTNGIKECYVLAGAYTAINGDVTFAHLYEATTCTFNNNVLDMTLHLQTNDPQSNISCAGTVGCFRIDNSVDRPSGEFYNIPKNTMRFYGGGIQFSNCLPEPTEEYLQAKAAASQTTAAPEATPAPAGDSSEYDKVPKTGESSQTVWLIGLVSAAAILFAGSYRLYKKTN
ncbi:MAG: hypothetical protein K2J60_01025 [Acetatifactor sp.]|nr:hypothetical protein [Acetatifactor sp.]